jgi:hypothetical protein
MDPGDTRMLFAPLRHRHAVGIVPLHPDHQSAHAAVDEPGRVGVDRLAPEAHEPVHFLDE